MTTAWNKAAAKAIVERRFANMKVISMSGLANGGVTIACVVDGFEEITFEVDRESWKRVCDNADWFRTGRK